MNPTVGDCPGNAAKMLRWIREASAQGADLVVFPECALCGYPVWDLANKKSFIEAGLRELKKIAAATRGLKTAVVLGFINAGPACGVRCATKRKSRDFALHTSFSFNAAAWLEAGKVRAIYHKRLLPTCDVFLEQIFFRAGNKPCVMPFRGHRIGLTICEDIRDAAYDVKPLAELKRKGADLVINISASPYFEGVGAKREALVRAHVRRYQVPMIYVNQVGGQDDLLFDGRSFCCDSRGRVTFQAPAFEERLLLAGEPIQPTRLDSVGEMYQALVLGVRDYFRKNGFGKALIGLSGGIDSALVATIAVDALGKDAVKGVTLPGPYSSEGSWKDAEILARNLGIEFETRSIEPMYEVFLKGIRDSFHGARQGKDFKRVHSLAMENLQARLRGLELMYLSNSGGRLLLAAGNKSELAVGYCTLYGDMAGGLAVIGDVYKTDVYRLARHRNSIRAVIPEATLTKAPSAELRPNQRDRDSLPPYDVLDAILRAYIEKNLGCDEIVRKMKGKVSPAVIRDTVRKVDRSEHKRRQAPPVLRVSEKAWFGRRMPITNRFTG